MAENIQDNWKRVNESVVDSPFSGKVIDSKIEGTPAEERAFRVASKEKYLNDKRVKARVKSNKPEKRSFRKDAINKSGNASSVANSNPGHA